MLTKPVIILAIPMALFGAGYACGAILAAPDGVVEASEVAEDAAPQGKSGHHAPKEAQIAPEPVPLGQMIVPIEKPRVTTYIMAEISVVPSAGATGEAFASPEIGLRMRDAVLAEFHAAAEKPILQPATIDSDAMRDVLKDRLSRDFADVAEILFSTFYVQDVPRI